MGAIMGPGCFQGIMHRTRSNIQEKKEAGISHCIFLYKKNKKIRRLFNIFQ
jgi:hypothetical protein